MKYTFTHLGPSQQKSQLLPLHDPTSPKSLRSAHAQNLRLTRLRPHGHLLLQMRVKPPGEYLQDKAQSALRAMIL